MQGESGILKDDYTLKATKIRDIESKVKLGDRRTVSGEWKTHPVSPGKFTHLFSFCGVVLLCVITLCATCCDVLYNFRMGLGGSMS